MQPEDAEQAEIPTAEEDDRPEDADPDETGEAVPDPDEAGETGVDPAAEEDSRPEDAETAEAPAAPEEDADPQPLTVTVTASCEGPYRPGARITLRARVSDENYQGTIQWQYSADGGLTVCDVEDAEGAEYTFFLDEVNIAYWWRACLK